MTHVLPELRQSHLSDAQLRRLIDLDLLDEWEERAAIMEHDGKMGFRQAEMQAYKATLERRLGRQLELWEIDDG